MYSVSGYGRMIADQSRLVQYLSALEQAITPGCVVADIGTGPGLFALAACRAGARKVYAIEPDSVIQIAREAANANGFSDRLEFVQNFSTRVTLAERADVIVSDLRGVLPWFGEHLPSILDARSRLLTPNGILIARRDTVWAAAVEVPEIYARLVSPWQNGKHGFVLTPGLRFVTNTWIKSHIKPNELLGEPVCFYKLDYQEFEESDLKATIELRIEQPGVAHGFALWFDCLVLDQFQFSNAPGNEGSIYGIAFFPFPHPIAVSEAMRISILLRADLVGPDYVWRWETTVTAPDLPAVIFKQSTLSGIPLSSTQLEKRSTTFVPTLNADGQIDRFILSMIDGKTSVEEIAGALLARFPDACKTLTRAVDLVAEASSKYSK